MVCCLTQNARSKLKRCSAAWQPSSGIAVQSAGRPLGCPGSVPSPVRSSPKLHEYRCPALLAMEGLIPAMDMLCLSLCCMKETSQAHVVARSHQLRVSIMLLATCIYLLGRPWRRIPKPVSGASFPYLSGLIFPSLQTRVPVHFYSPILEILASRRCLHTVKSYSMFCDVRVA